MLVVTPLRLVVLIFHIPILFIWAAERTVLATNSGGVVTISPAKAQDVLVKYAKYIAVKGKHTSETSRG